jgi:threonine dehydrogenase-like Zn-dependent dehydrogenase
MRQIFYTKPGFVLKEVPEPGLMNPSDVKIKIAYSCVCGSDIRLGKGYYDFRHPGSQVSVGHEASGYVVALGAEAKSKGLSVGDKVTYFGYQYCGACRYCLAGRPNLCLNTKGFEKAMSDYLIVDESLVYKLPKDANMLLAAMIEPASVALHGVELLGISVGKTVAFSGGGGIGQIMAQFAARMGAEKITVIEPIRAKREIALACGADYAIDPAVEDVVRRSEEITGGFLFDAVVECSGEEAAIKPAYDIVGRGGTLEFIAMYKPGSAFHMDMMHNFFNKKENRVVFSYQAPHVFERTIHLYDKLNLRPLATVFEPERFEEAIAAQAQGGSVKSVLRFNP